MDPKEETQRAIQEGIRRAIDNDLRTRLNISPAVKIAVKRIVEGDQPIWVAYLTDKVNERILVTANLVEELKNKAREKFYDNEATKEFIQSFGSEDPVFFEKAFQSKKEKPQTPETEHFGIMVEVLSAAHSGNTEDAVAILAEYVLDMAIALGLEDQLMDNESLEGLYEPVTTLQIRRR